jgi:hypothetical protein
MSVYQSVVALARQQAEAASHGDMDRVVRLLGQRGALLETAAAASEADRAAIEETLKLDREIAGAIRQRMLHIRQEVLNLRHGQTALAGYGSTAARRSRLDSRC